MAHVPERPTQYVCESCQVTYAGTPVHVSGGDHAFEPPEECGICGEATFVRFDEWVHHHE